MKHLLLIALLLASVILLCLPGLSQSAPLPSYQPSYAAGMTDTSGNLLYGTETMSLVPYKGKLYAGTSCWMETDAAQKACQLLILDSPGGAWRQLYKFAGTNLRLTALRTVTFTRDNVGSTVSPVTMLLATASRTTAGTVQVFSLNDSTGSMVAMSLGTTTVSQQTRAIGFHHDPVTGVDLVFAGNDELGIVPGGYNPSVTGRIQWNTAGSELTVPSGERVMSFTEANGVFYCATSNHIYQRTDRGAPY